MRQIWSQLAFVAMVAACGSAWRWGGPLERRVAVLVAASWIATLLVQRISGQVAAVTGLLLVDLAVLGVLIALSWGDRAGWMVFAVASQGVAVGVHLIRLVSPSMSSWTYLTALAAAGYGLLASLAFGTWTYRKGLSS